MTVRVEWEKRAQRDREDIFLYLNREAGDEVAIAADDRLAGMTGILEENPLAGVKAGRLENRERSEFCVTLKILQRHHIIQSPFKING